MRPIRSLLTALALAVFGLTFLSGCSQPVDSKKNMTPDQKVEDAKKHKEKEGD